MDSMKKISQKERKYLLDLARRSMEYYEKTNEFLEEEDVPETLKEELATFVSVYVGKNLRGCIGTLHAINPVYKDVMHNAVAAAFFDDRFPPLTTEEIKKAKIEISILTKPEKIKFKSTSDLLKKVKPKEDGILLEKEERKATFLPQVWDHFSKKEDFFDHLCMKAGLEANEWKKPGIEVSKYNCIVFNSDK